MNKNLIKVTLSLLFVLGLYLNAGAQATTKVIVTTLNGSETTYVLTSDDYINFGDGQNLIINASGSPQSIALSNIRKVEFEKITDGLDCNRTEIEIYPNPTSNTFHVSNLVKTEEMTIYNITGQKVMSCIIENNQTIDVSNMANGLYFIKIGDKNIKLMKR